MNVQFLNSPTIVIIHATKYESDPIQTMHIRNVNGNKFLNRFCSQFGMVKKNRAKKIYGQNYVLTEYFTIIGKKLYLPLARL